MIACQITSVSYFKMSAAAVKAVPRKSLEYLIFPMFAKFRMHFLEHPALEGYNYGTLFPCTDLPAVEALSHI